MSVIPQRKIRVLQLVDSLSMGGAERAVALLATHVDRERFDVIPCALLASGPLEAELKAVGVPYRVLGLRRRSILTGPLFAVDVQRMVVALMETLKELSIDIVHAHLTDSTLLGVFAARRTGVTRVCTTAHNTILSLPRTRLSPRGWLMQKAMRKTLPRTDRIIAVSEAVAQALRDSICTPAEHIVTIPNGVESDRYRFAGDRRAARQNLGLPTDRLILVTVGRLAEQKGYPYLLDALALIPLAQRPLTLVVGEGPERHKLESKAAAMELAKDIQFLGNRSDVPDLLAAADLFALSSLWEGLPLSLLEAMAADLPAVVTAVGGNTEVVEDGVSGLLVAAGDARAMATALTSLLIDPLRRQEMGKAARERFNHSFSVQRFVHAHESLYENMLS